MSRVKHLGSILVGLIMIIWAFILTIFTPKEAYATIIMVLCLGLLIFGIRELHFYLTMAKHMTGGKTKLYRAIILIDMGLFTMALTDVPLVYVMLYLASIHLFTGGVDILRALEARNLQAGSWKMQFIHGLINVILAVLCLIFIKSTSTAINIYALGLAWSGVMRIIQATRKTEIVYIQ